MKTDTIAANASGLIRLAVRPDLRPQVHEQAMLQKELQLDSIDLASLAIDLEDFFQIEIGDQAIAAWRTVADITAAVAEALAEAEAEAEPQPTHRVAQPDYAALGIGSAEEAEGRN